MFSLIIALRKYLCLGIRLLDGEVTDLVESMALSFRPDFIDIYSASWYVIDFSYRDFI